MDKYFIKLTAVVISFMFLVAITPNIHGAQFFFKPRKSNSSYPSGEVGIRIPFGPGAQPENKNIIEKLKKEETKGAGALIGLIVLGACIVGAAMLISNKAEDVKEDILDKADDAEETLDELGDRLEDKLDDIF